MTLDVERAWPGLSLVEQISGNRNHVWRGELNGRSVSVRRSRRTERSLEWELRLLEFLNGAGFRVPLPIRTPLGEAHVKGIVVQDWLEGDSPSTDTDWVAVGRELQRLHAATSSAGFLQRPGCLTVLELGASGASVDADMAALPPEVRRELLVAFEAVSDVPVAVIHGDPGASNIRITADGTVAFLDFDESRVDVVWHDLSNLGVSVLNADEHALAVRLSHAWETANAWVVEPEYAKRRLRALRQLED